MIKEIVLYKMTSTVSQKLLKYFVLSLEAIAVALVIYLIVLPFYPNLKYTLLYNHSADQEAAQDAAAVREQLAQFRNSFPGSEYAVSPNRLIIKKIGVNAPIVESNSAEYGLSRGAWHLPESSTPDRGGNTIITGHRFKYLPPNNLTFYLFDKLAIGDVIAVIWHGADYVYRIKDIKIVEKTDLSVLDPSAEPIITLFTCHPIYSTEQRLVVIGELVEG